MRRQAGAVLPPTRASPGSRAKIVAFAGVPVVATMVAAAGGLPHDTEFPVWKAMVPVRPAAMG